MLSPPAPPDHVDVIEGQGSLFHPAYAAVSLGLLHGSQPDMFVVCHQPSRTHVLGHPAFPLPPIEQVIERTIAFGRLTNDSIHCVGVSLNTADLEDEQALRLFDRESERRRDQDKGQDCLGEREEPGRIGEVLHGAILEFLVHFR